MSGRRLCIAIDGPVSAGKSTIARLVAGELGYAYVDSGAMYRALAWAAREEGVSPEDVAGVRSLLESIEIELVPQSGGANRVRVNGREITEEIRAPEIGQLSSLLSEISGVRERMVALQREMAREGGVVMEGRDIQTVVMPEAEVKIFLTAPAEERARRRHLELRERGFEAELQTVLAGIKKRDGRDSNRKHSPLRAAPEAVVVDSGGLGIEEVVARVLAVVREKRAAASGA
ncbi:MAG: (d)CMP kinase [Proteobacteria bacterium]|nr:(d)CMP kinase [Pseudomonadota bacterium]